MTTPTIADVGHRTKEPSLMEIDGFRGRLISAGQPTTTSPVVVGVGFSRTPLYSTTTEAFLLSMAHAD